MENKEDRTFHSVMNLVATHYNCTSPMDYISHHALHTHIPVHHYTNHTAVTIHSLVLIFSPHLHLIYSHTFKQHSHMHSLRLVLNKTKVLFCYAIISERFFRVWFPVYDLDRLLDSESPLPAYCNHICHVYWLPRVFAASPDHKPELWLWFCLAYVVFEASVWTLPVWPPLCINKAAIGSNYTASALHIDQVYSFYLLEVFSDNVICLSNRLRHAF